MKTIKELHELERPLSEYLCGRGVDSGVDAAYPRKYFVYLWHPGSREVLEEEYTGDEADARIKEIRRLIEAARKIAT